MTHFDFFGKGIEIIKQAIKEDESHHFPEALRLYIHGVTYWMTGLKCNFSLSLFLSFSLYFLLSNYFIH